MICFALLATTVFYYNLIIYLTENKPMILPYTYHKTRDSLKKVINQSGQTVVLFENLDTVDTSISFAVKAGYFHEQNLRLAEGIANLV